MKDNQLTAEFKARYDLVRRLGAGGMGTLYLAKDKKLDREVAIKFILAESVDANLKRFQREAEVQKGLKHSNIAQLLDYSASEPPFIVFEYVKGETLNDKLLAEGRLAVDRACFYGKEICRGMSYAQGQGVVHRDLKSENVMLTPEGGLKIIDFGLARNNELTSTITKTGIILGTPAYIAPEVIAGEKPSALGDIYATGVLLFEMVTGELPFKGDNALAVLRRQLKEPSPDPRAILPGLDERFAAIISHAMAKKPEERYGSFSELYNDLVRFEQGNESSDAITREVPSVNAVSQKEKGHATVSINRPVASTRAVVTEKPKPPIAKILGSLCLLLVLGAVLYWGSLPPPEPEWIKTVKVRAAATSVEITWQTKLPKRFEYAIVGAKDKRLYLRSQEEKEVKEHRLVIPKLKSEKGYAVELAFAGHSISRAFKTAAAKLTKAVLVCASEKSLYLDFASNVPQGLVLQLEDESKQRLFSRRCDGEGPFLFDLPKKSANKTFHWHLKCGEKGLAKGAVKASVPTYKPPLRRHFTEKMSKSGPQLFFGSSMVWQGETLIVSDMDGAITAYKLNRQQGQSKQAGILKLAWLLRSPATLPYGHQAYTGTLTPLPDGRVFSTTILNNGKYQIQVLSPEQREKEWKRLKNSAEDELPSWCFNQKSSWNGPLEGEDFVSLSTRNYGHNFPYNGVYKDGIVYYLTATKKFIICHAYDVKSKEIRTFQRFHHFALRSITGEPRQYWPLGHLYECGGRLFSLVRTTQRTKITAGPYEYWVVSWSATSGEVHSSMRFQNFSDLLQPVIDRKRQLLWMVARQNVRRVKIVKGEIVDKKASRLFRHKDRRGTLFGACCPGEDGLFFVRHEPTGYFAMTIELAPGVIAGHMYLYHIDGEGENLIRFTPTFDTDPVTPLYGGCREMKHIGDKVVAFDSRKLYVLQTIAGKKVKSASIRPISLKMGEALCNWAIHPDGYIAINTLTGKLAVVPLELAFKGARLSH